MEGQAIILSGRADDNQDGIVAASNLNWHSDRDGDLGSGAELVVFLSVGTHVLTLEAENSAGLQASTSITIIVEGDYDYDGLTDEDELDNNLNPLTEKDAYSDEDGDTLPFVMEYQRGIDPNNPDSDGDGRNDNEEIVEGTDPGASDTPPPADELEVYPSSLTFEGDLSLDTPLPQQQLQIASQIPTTWTLSADVEWLAANRIMGTTPDVSSILVDAYLLDEGVHTGNLTFASEALDSTVTVPVTVTISNAAGYFDFDNNGVNIGDVQQVAADIPSDETQSDFNYRHDIDRDSDIDEQDAQRIAEQWTTLRNCCGTGHANSPSVLRVEAPSSAMTGESFTVMVLIDDPQNLGGFEFDLTFDATMLEVQNVELGDLLASSGRTSAQMGPVIDNSTGVISFGGYSYGNNAGASSNGIVAQITFRAIRAGNSALNIQQHLLADVNGTLSQGTSEGATITLKGRGHRQYPVPADNAEIEKASIIRKRIISFPFDQRVWYNPFFLMTAQRDLCVWNWIRAYLIDFFVYLYSL